MHTKYVPLFAAFAVLTVRVAPAIAQPPSLAAMYTFQTVDYPGAVVSFPLGINNNRQIAGTYIDTGGVSHGYVRTAGTFATIDVPGALMVPGAGASAGGINDRGDVAGLYYGQDGYQHGYIRTIPAGCTQDNRDARCAPVYTTLDYPGAAQTRTVPFEFGFGLGTAGVGINNSDSVVGIYATSALYSNGFVWSKGVFTPIDSPQASHLTGNGTKLFTISNNGLIAGDFITQQDLTSPPVSHGFVLDTLGRYTPVYVPGSELGGLGTQVNGVNPRKWAVGTFTSPEPALHGLLWIEGQNYTLDFPGSLYSECHSINDSGLITGAYSDDPAGRVTHGFLATPKF